MKSNLVKFLMFLDENEVLLSYLINLDANDYVRVSSFTGARGYLLASFPWANTQEGDNFWRAINEKWRYEVE